jgi:beta-mannanase
VLQSAVGRQVGTVLWYQNWGGGGWISSVQRHLLDGVSASGRTPLLSWEPWDPAAGTPNQPNFALRRIAGGDFDAYIATWAEQLREVGTTVYLRPMHEMNGNWYPWGGSVNGNSPALYVQAWRRMHDIFVRRGATNVRWVWAPNNVDVPQTSANQLERFYPGDSYVDVLGVDGYNWGTGQPGWAGWESFSEVFSTAYERLRRLGPQPIWITEVGSAPQGGDKSAWIRDMFARAGRMDRLEKIIWFNENKERDWRANPSPDVAAAFNP